MKHSPPGRGAQAGAVFHPGLGEDRDGFSVEWNSLLLLLLLLLLNGLPILYKNPDIHDDLQS